ncbi:glycoside hydrolase family 127 protein [Aquisphaera insulae]|uniref:glycoside hydrolase family 127 protein n=1 Tax=Aquisphaera insulae TaxID=2712864 RepID=UPI0013EA3001|nr:beta-L-arabinofuranosidase domain-containing protein [Aquisphaera insulae]
MKYALLATSLFLLASPIVPADDIPLLKLHAVPFTDVEIRDGFWSPRQEVNRKVSIPINFAMLEKSGNIKNLELAAARATAGFEGPVFMDSDIYKALEAASYSLATHPDPALDKQLDEIIAKIAGAQLEDGYLDTYYVVKEPGRRWTNLRDNHELYCAGHMIEAAVAHYRATGKKNFLAVATKTADHIDSTFGKDKRLGYCGHPEVELALIKLWQATGEKRYFELARFFIENRGRKFFAAEHHTPESEYDGTYWQDDVPICDHKNIKGHAVRAAYLLSGATDVAAETQDPALLKMIRRVWRNTVERNMYLTGGIGPSASNEGFTHDYDLPNLTAYQETCASVALAQWNHRLALLYGDSKYADVVERALYNGVLAGVSLDGKRFFYVNPLESTGRHHRSEWFGCACCPPNVARTLASLGGYAYAVGDKSLWVNLYIQGSTKVDVDGHKVKLDVTTEYPWDGDVRFKFTLDQPAKFDLRLRLPSWCSDAKVSIGENGATTLDPGTDRGYLVVSREWKTGDTVRLNMKMPVVQVAANPNVEADTGRLAFQRGPLVYCVEAADNESGLDSLFVPRGTELKAEKAADVLGGVVVLRGSAETAPEMDWHARLYQAVPVSRQVPLTAIPYYAWDNRKPGPMKVWLPTAPRTPGPGGPETQAAVKLSFRSGNAQPWGVNDGVEPKTSGEQPQALCHFWPHSGTREYVEYDWKTPRIVGSSKAYWFDDTGRGACRYPASWSIEYRDGDAWKPVVARGSYPIVKDGWSEVTFAPVKTTGLRLVVQLQPRWAAGVHEWKVEEAEED